MYPPCIGTWTTSPPHRVSCTLVLSSVPTLTLTSLLTGLKLSSYLGSKVMWAWQMSQEVTLEVCVTIGRA